MPGTGMIIVGAGEAGARAAEELRMQGWNGSITLIGKESFVPYERPPLSKSLLTSVDEPMLNPIISSDRFAELDIRFISESTVVRIDRGAHFVELNNGQQLQYERLLLSTGASPRRLQLEGADTGGVSYLRTFGDAVTLRSRLAEGKRLVVIGAGFIGLEVAASARALGCSVTVLEQGTRILMRAVPEDIANIVAERHLREGVNFKLGVGLRRILRENEEYALYMQDGTVIRADEIVAGIGAIPATRLAEQSDLCVDNGIKTDETLTTNDPDILAAGDCCNFPHPLYGGRRMRLEAWRNARDQGTHAAINMIGGNKPYTEIPWFWSDQYDLMLQVAGLPECGERTICRELNSIDRLYFHLSGDGRLVAASAIGRQDRIAKEMRLSERLILQKSVLDPAKLKDADVRIKSLLIN